MRSSLPKLLQKRGFQNGSNGSRRFPCNFKLPRMEAVRDFPVNCGHQYPTGVKGPKPNVGTNLASTANGGENACYPDGKNTSNWAKNVAAVLAMPSKSITDLQWNCGSSCPLHGKDDIGFGEKLANDKEKGAGSKDEYLMDEVEELDALIAQAKEYIISYDVESCRPKGVQYKDLKGKGQVPLFGSYDLCEGASTTKTTQGQEGAGRDKIIVSKNMVEVEARVPKVVKGERAYAVENIRKINKNVSLEEHNQAVSRAVFIREGFEAIGRYSDNHELKCNEKQKELINLTVVKRDDPEGYIVKNVLKLFEEQYTQLMKERKSKSSRENKVMKCPNMGVAKCLKEQRMWLCPKKPFGHVPGVEIGDKFILRAELVVIGLHRQFFSGIDYQVLDGQIYATSIVNAGRYKNETKSVDVLIYSGQGGNAKFATDQKLEKGNLAMMNSMEMGYPIRVTYKRKNWITYNDLGVRKHQNFVYVYDGLYTINKMWQERDQNGILVFKFELLRLLGQPRTRGTNAKSRKLVNSR